MTEHMRQQGEDFISWFIRLFENKADYGLTCEDIASLLNEDQGTDYSESKWRKDFKMFNKGREYERKLRFGSVENRILCLSDQHVPFQLPASTFAKYCGRVDTLVLNGDIADCQAISKFPKTYRVSPMDELIEARQYMIDLIEVIQPKEVVVIYGNHDIRFQSYMARSLDSDILELMPQTSLELICIDGFHHYNKRSRTKVYYPPLTEVLDEVKITYVDNWYAQIGDTIFCHPIAFSTGIMKTADKAVDYFRNAGMVFKNLVMAHTHRVGFYKEGSTTMYEQGCCCDVKKCHYADGKLTAPQKEGYVYLGQDINGNTIAESVDLVSLN